MIQQNPYSQKLDPVDTTYGDFGCGHGFFHPPDGSRLLHGQTPLCTESVTRDRKPSKPRHDITPINDISRFVTMNLTS